MVMREKPLENRGPDSVWPLFFWCECEECRREFRRETLWRQDFGEMAVSWKYLCMGCAPYPALATWMFTNMRHGKNPDRPPPAPPTRAVRGDIRPPKPRAAPPRER